MAREAIMLYTYSTRRGSYWNDIHLCFLLFWDATLVRSDKEIKNGLTYTIIHDCVLNTGLMITIRFLFTDNA